MLPALKPSRHNTKLGRKLVRSPKLIFFNRSYGSPREEIRNCSKVQKKLLFLF